MLIKALLFDKMLSETKVGHVQRLIFTINAKLEYDINNPLMNIIDILVLLMRAEDVLFLKVPSYFASSLDIGMI